MFGILRGRYMSPAFAIKVGETAIRNCFRDQLTAIRKEGMDYMGIHPCLFTEIGIPYDMDDKYAYKTGDYTSQALAMDANHFALEGCGANGYALWVYTTQVHLLFLSCLGYIANRSQNNHEWGDNWNGEDLSIFSLDDKPLPLSPHAKSEDPTRSTNTSTVSLDRTSPSYSQSRTSDSQTPINQSNLKTTLSTPSMSSARSTTPANLGSNPGFRAAEAYVRPSPIATVGKVQSYGFDLRNATFTLTLTSGSPCVEDTPTEIFLPEFHFPSENSKVEVTSGKWTLDVDDEDGGLIQRFRWWHGAGEQTVKVKGVQRRQGMALGKEEEEGYLDQCQQSRCLVM